MKLSRRAEQIQPSVTLAITAKAKQMKAQGIDVIGFGAGEPDFPTPEHIVDSAVQALRDGDTRYTPVGGTPELRAAVAHGIQRDYGLTYNTSEITVSCGAKHTLFNLFMALVDEGDEVVIPAPYWVSYPEQVQVAGGTPVFAPAVEKDGFLLSPESLASVLTPRTKALVLNSPSNPTGAMYSDDQLRALAEVIKDRDIVVVSDDIYHKLTYDGARFASILQVAPNLRDRVVIVNGVSKTYAMTGWRIGYAAGPKALITAMEDIQSQSTSNPTSFAQKGAATAITGPQECVDAMVNAFWERAKYLIGSLNALPGVHCRMPQGAFYAFPNMSALYGRRTESGTVVSDSVSLTAFLLEEARVAVVPGGPFGADDHIRISYTTSMEQLREGMDRIAGAVSRLQSP